MQGAMTDRIIKMHKRKFDSQLRHIKVILVSYRKTMSPQQWLDFFFEVKECIVRYPDDFICSELPNKKVTHQIINLVFDGFLRDVHIRQVQAFRNAANARVP
jgi:hypothetical protein